jgi:hypothetical protein
MTDAHRYGKLHIMQTDPLVSEWSVCGPGAGHFMK